MNSEGKESHLADSSSYPTINGKKFTILSKNEKIPVTFKKKFDGDTFGVLLNNKEIKERLLLIDTPESVKESQELPMYIVLVRAN